MSNFIIQGADSSSFQKPPLTSVYQCAIYSYFQGCGGAGMDGNSVPTPF